MSFKVGDNVELLGTKKVGNYSWQDFLKLSGYNKGDIVNITKIEDTECIINSLGKTDSGYWYFHESDLKLVENQKCFKIGDMVFYRKEIRNSYYFRKRPTAL